MPHPPGASDSESPTVARRRPDLFIIGAAKSGTTSLYEYLKGHPEVFMSPAKEPRYFAPDLAGRDTGHDLLYGRDLDRYLALFADARDEKRLGEASVRYIYSSEAARLIHDFQPNAYIVAMLRNPVDMMYSLHGQLYSEGTERVADFEQALAEQERDGGKRNRPGSRVPIAGYRARARYGQQLPRWFETFGRERIHVILFEEFVRDPAPGFRRLLQFLDVDPDISPDSFAAHNVSHLPRSFTVRALLKSRLPQWFAWQLMPRLVGDRATRGLVRRFRHSRFYRRPAERPPLSPDLRRRLEEEFADDVAKVSALIDRDLATLWWADSQPAAGDETLPAASP